jgi:hypothetical protein
MPNSTLQSSAKHEVNDHREHPAMAVSFNAKRLSSSWPSRRSDLGIRRKSFPETTLRANFFAETTLAPQESAKSLKAANFFTEYGYTPPPICNHPVAH